MVTGTILSVASSTEHRLQLVAEIDFVHKRLSIRCAQPKVRVRGSKVHAWVVILSV